MLFLLFLPVIVKQSCVAILPPVYILFNSKCLPVLLYGLEACSLSKSDLSSIDFAFNRFFMKLFRTNNIETVKVCQFLFWSISSKRCVAQ